MSEEVTIAEIAEMSSFCKIDSGDAALNLNICSEEEYNSRCSQRNKSVKSCCRVGLAIALKSLVKLLKGHCPKKTKSTFYDDAKGAGNHVIMPTTDFDYLKRPDRFRIGKIGTTLVLLKMSYTPKIFPAIEDYYYLLVKMLHDVPDLRGDFNIIATQKKLETKMTDKYHMTYEYIRYLFPRSRHQETDASQQQAVISRQYGRRPPYQQQSNMLGPIHPPPPAGIYKNLARQMFGMMRLNPVDVQTLNISH